jgi:hypothetical protein
MSFAKFMNMLMLDQMHFHVASGFNDDFEGTVPESVRDIMEEEYAAAAEEGDFPEWAGGAQEACRRAPGHHLSQLLAQQGP